MVPLVPLLKSSQDGCRRLDARLVHVHLRVGVRLGVRAGVRVRARARPRRSAGPRTHAHMYLLEAPLKSVHMRTCTCWKRRSRAASFSMYYGYFLTDLLTYLLEAPLKSRILLDVFAVLVKRRRSDTAQLAAREGGLEEVTRVHCPVAGSSAHHRVDLVYKEDNLARRLLHLGQHRLEPLLKLAWIRDRDRVRVGFRVGVRVRVRVTSPP